MREDGGLAWRESRPQASLHGRAQNTVVVRGIVGLLTIEPREPCSPPFKDKMQRGLGTKQREIKLDASKLFQIYIF